MLKHEDMIENVHRRIAQYEADKKNKYLRFNNIISVIKPTAKKGSAKNNDDEYTEVVSGTETINPSNRMIRIVSSAAAGVILATGIGATGFLLYKNKSPNPGLPEEKIAFTQGTGTADANEAASDSASPFGDFNRFYFSIGELNKSYKEYSSETYERLANCLNAFSWGEGNEISEENIPDFDNYEGNGYYIGWQKGDMYFDVYVLEDGKAYYLSKQCKPVDLNFYYPITESLVYDIDYEAFDKDVQDILSRDVPDTGEYISRRQKMYLSQGEFRNGMAERYEGFDSEEVIPENHKSFKALQGFLRDDFLDMLQKDKAIGYDSDNLLYTVECYYKTSNTTTRRLTYYISSNGAVNLCEYELTEYNDIPTGSADYYIDIKEFESVLNDILSGTYDDKYTFEVKAATTAVTTSATETTTVTTTEQVNAHEEGSEDEPVEKEPTDEDIFREYYLSLSDGWGGSIDKTFMAMDEETGNMVDYKDIINYMLHRADVLPIDRVLGPVADEDDAIAKGRELLLDLRGQEYIDRQEREYTVMHDDIMIYRDNPCYLADYNAEYDIWDFRPTLFSGSSEDGHYHVETPGSVPHFYIRGCDGKILACYN